MEKKELKAVAVRLPVDTLKALKMFCVDSDQTLQDAINKAIIEMLDRKSESGPFVQNYFLCNPELKAEVAKLKAERERLKDPDGKKKRANLKRQITRLKNESIKRKAFL